MRKFFPHISSLILTLTLVFVVGGLFVPNALQAHTFPRPQGGQCPEGHVERVVGVGNSVGVSCVHPDSTQEQVNRDAGKGALATVNKILEFGTNILIAPLGWLAILILQVANLLTWLAGSILNYVTQYTIVEMSDNIRDVTTLNKAWTTIRDLANMGFIFILLYAAIQTILGIGSDVKKTIINVVVVAILINFSLFFTRIVIDISNVLAILFYDAIAPGALDGSVTTGLAGKLVQHLYITNLFDTSGGVVSLAGQAFEGKKLIIIGLMGSVVSLITAFVLFAAAIMLIIRFVVLIMVMILSPLAFMGLVLPEFKKVWNQWWDALSGQAFFAPILLMLLWIVVTIASSGFIDIKGGSMVELFTGSVGADGSSPSAPSQSSVALIVNFIVMIAFLIAALVIAKEWAGKAGPAVSGATKWAIGAASDKGIGGLGWAGRASIGRFGAMAAESARLQEAANKRTGFAGAASRLALYTANKAKAGTFDARNATIPTSVVGAAIEGTVGRTKIGKKLGFNDVPIPSVAVGAFAAGQTGVGEGGKRGFVDTREESRKRVHDREAGAAEDLAQAQARRDVRNGADAAVGSPAYNAMEKALAKLTDKQTEALVASNRELLQKQNFANAISVKQLEALNKSDQFSEAERGALKERRFSDINTALAPGGAGATSVRGKIRGLSDSELEMINPDHLKNLDFVEQMKASQIESVNKSSKFTSSQKRDLQNTRRAPLFGALATGTVANVQASLKDLGPKEVAALEMNTGELLHPTMLQAYTQQMLKRMGPELNPADILPLGTAIATAGGPASAWVTSADGRNNGFS
ncbi:MAG: hypothetical protein WAX80_01095 [Minisyncoccia bacterium]